MNHYAELLRHLPASGIAGALVPIAQFAFERLKARQSVHRKRELRGSVLALNSFIRSITDAQEIDGHHAGCLEDALRERGLILKQLESLIAAESGRSRRLPAMSPIQRWFLLYVPSRPIGWALRWTFFHTAHSDSGWCCPWAASPQLSADAGSCAVLDWHVHPHRARTAGSLARRGCETKARLRAGPRNGNWQGSSGSMSSSGQEARFIPQQ